MTEMICLTPEQKRDLLRAVNDKRLYADVAFKDNMRIYTLSNKQNVVVYSIEAYNNKKRVVRHNGQVIADSTTFGTNAALLKEINFILSLLINRYTQEINMAARTGKRR